MKKLSQNARFLLLGVLTIVVVAAACFASYQLGVSRTRRAWIGQPDWSSHSYPPKNFPKNKSGQTYGSSSDTEYGEEPDLIAVVATNGKKGYILKTDLHKVDRSDVKNPDEAVQVMAVYNAAASKGFVEALSQSWGFDAATITSEQALRAYEEMNSYNPAQSEADRKELVAEIAAKIKSDLGLTTGQDITEDELLKAVSASQNATAQSIPVYKVDGKTRIGVFEVF